MSEYQCYEFVTLDRPLSAKQMAELRAISTRAEITPTRFWNEYHWGDLKADPARLLARYFDAHLYFANWGTHRFMLRLPADRRDVVDERALRPYFPGSTVKLTKVGRHLVLDLWGVEVDEPPDEEWFEGSQLAALTPLRASLLQGDFAVAYLAWLVAVQMEEVSDDAREPPVPAGLRSPSAPLSALAAFLYIDPDLLEAAAEASPASDLAPADLANWIKKLPVADKERWLLRAVEQPEQPLGGELIAAYRRQAPVPAQPARRTVAELRARADEVRQAREEAEARREARQRRRAEAARRKHLDALAQQGDQAWARLDELVDARAYEQAVQLTVDLHDVAARAGALAEFESRFAATKKRHARRRGYISAVNRELASKRALAVSMPSRPEK